MDHQQKKSRNKKDDDDGRTKKTCSHNDCDDDVVNLGKVQFQECVEKCFQLINDNDHERTKLATIRELKLKPIETKLEECKKRYRSLQVQHDRIAADNEDIQGQVDALSSLHQQTPTQPQKEMVLAARPILSSSSSSIQQVIRTNTITPMSPSQATNNNKNNDDSSTIARNFRTEGSVPYNPYARTKKPKRSSPGETIGRNTSTIKNAKKRKTFFSSGTHDTGSTNDAVSSSGTKGKWNHSIDEQNELLDINNGDSKNKQGTECGNRDSSYVKETVASKYNMDPKILIFSAVSDISNGDSKLDDMNQDSFDMKEPYDISSSNIISTESPRTPTDTTSTNHRFMNFRHRQFGCSLIGISSSSKHRS
jgi:hypothetical protein